MPTKRSERCFWRKGWDSNPRGACTPGGFQDRCLKPLGHPSSLATSTTDALALADKDRHCRQIAPPTSVCGAVVWPGLILKKRRALRGERRRSRAGRLSGPGPALALARPKSRSAERGRKKENPAGMRG